VTSLKLEGNIRKKPSILISTLLHQFLSALALVVSSLLFVVFSTMHALVSQSKTGRISDLGSAAEYGIFR